MSDKTYTSIDEFDKEFEDLFSDEGEDDEEAADGDEGLVGSEESATEETEVEEDTMEEQAEEGSDEPESTENEEEQPTTPKPEDKQAFAFETLRKENQSYKKKVSEVSERLTRIEEMARASGYEDIQSFLEAWEEDQLKREAHAKNVDVGIYRELTEAKRKVNNFERSKKQEEAVLKVNELTKEIQNFSKELKLTEKETALILDEMESDGYTVDSLAALPTKSVGKILRGYAADRVAEAKLQKRLAEIEKTGGTKEPKVKTGTGKATDSNDPYSSEALAKEMAEFKRKNYPWL